MKREDSLDMVRGSGNVFRDLRSKNPDTAQLKAILASEIIKVLDSECLTVRQAHARTGVAAADFSRVRNADLDRFTAQRIRHVDITTAGDGDAVAVMADMVDDEALAVSHGARP